MESQLSRRRVARAFKMRGLVVQSSALDAVLNVLDREPASHQQVLEALLDELRERIMTSSLSSGRQSIVTESLLADVVADLSRNGTDVSDEALQLLDAFDTPRLTFDSMRKHFTLLTDRDETRSLFGEAKHKVEMYSQRYALVQQRILRQDLFRPKLVTADGRHVSGDDRNVTHAITPVESLLGRNGPTFLLGMIVQVEEGRFYLEDSTAQVPLDLSGASVLTDGFITENCIVLVEGEMVDGILLVHRMGNPIVETRLESIDAIGIQNTDMFSAMSTMAEVDKLREQEEQHGSDGMFVIMSDVHLDKSHVLEKLATLFEGFQHMDPLPVFVLMGNFSSVPMSAEGPSVMIGYFEELANLVAKYPRLANDARFVFVPGNHDPGMGEILPRPPLPKYFTGALRSKARHAHFGTNPCRIRYFSKELVFLRHDLVHPLRRSCIVPPRRQGDTSSSNEGVPATHTAAKANKDAWVQHTVKTILDQGHLCPLPSIPVYWQFDHALRLYPLPDAVVLGDRVEQFYENYADCDAINPGPFSNDFSFVVYRPVASVDDDSLTKSDVEFSQIGDEDGK